MTATKAFEELTVAAYADAAVTAPELFVDDPPPLPQRAIRIRGVQWEGSHP